MPRIKIEDLPVLEELSAQEMEGIVGGGGGHNPFGNGELPGC